MRLARSGGAWLGSIWWKRETLTEHPVAGYSARHVRTQSQVCYTEGNMIPSESFLHYLAHQALQSIFRALWEAYRKIQLYQCCPSEIYLIERWGLPSGTSESFWRLFCVLNGGCKTTYTKYTDGQLHQELLEVQDTLTFRFLGMILKQVANCYQGETKVSKLHLILLKGHWLLTKSQSGKTISLHPPFTITAFLI